MEDTMLDDNNNSDNSNLNTCKGISLERDPAQEWQDRMDRRDKERHDEYMSLIGWSIFTVFIVGATIISWMGL
jgi:hypothetical protein